MGGRISNDSPCRKTSPTKGLNLSPSPAVSRALPCRDAINSDRVCQVCRDGVSGMRPHTCRREDSFAFPRTNTDLVLSVRHVVTKLHLSVSTLSRRGLQQALSPLAQREERKKNPSPRTAAVTPPKLFTPTTLAKPISKNYCIIPGF